ncbi:LuxR C-terminal-related transcriptional regulator [Buttiauxella selenatireducens]|uniref:LuxR C-terminal-related transcriptional regulator n=1 Tax=Buttiauxella selenatireducens TaxID=3073902 RepID=A0ABY9S8T4_9ENTR|nr:LuxR C-terminal-related transcriptional regulator [Buttiauxella sp. R73]WMY73535.1 LuxR C-terminal-related transcriptional regulator [Buttiauxella sp. R73]
MNIYILTENNYLFYGIEQSLSEHVNCQCIHLNPAEYDASKHLHLIQRRDVFIIANDFHNMDFSLLMKLNETDASVIIATDNAEWNISSIFRFATIMRRFYLSDLLQNIHLIQPVRSKKIKLPKITISEKRVLLLTFKGIDIDYISSRLNISTKTAYSHQRNAFKKIGIRKIHDIFRLPGNYISYLCQGY